MPNLAYSHLDVWIRNGQKLTAKASFAGAWR